MQPRRGRDRTCHHALGFLLVTCHTPGSSGKHGRIDLTSWPDALTFINAPTVGVGNLGAHGAPNR